MTEQPPQLDYRNPADETGGGRLVVQALVACSLTCGLVVGIVFVLILTAVVTEAHAAVIVLLVTASFGVLWGLLYLAVRARRVPTRRGWAIGIWLGIGLAGLFE